jgi:MFS family permease
MSGGAWVLGAVLGAVVGLALAGRRGWPPAVGVLLGAGIGPLLVLGFLFPAPPELAPCPRCGRSGLPAGATWCPCGADRRPGRWPA